MDDPAHKVVRAIVEGVDPRDTQWDVDWPVCRVYLWHQPPAPAGVAQEHAMWHCDEYRLGDVANVDEVLDWSRDKARSDQTFVIYAEQRDARQSGLVRLFGVETHSVAESPGIYQ